MRIAWSLFAMTTTMPSSTPLRPIFHASATRMANDSIGSGKVVPVISTAIWLPLRFSNASRLASSSRFCSALSVPFRSTTRPVRGGIDASSATAQKASSSAAAATARISSIISSLVLRRLGLGEIHRRRLGDHLFVFDRESRLDLVAEQHRRQVAGEGTHGDVVVLHRPDVTLACHGDAVLGTFELRLQVAEIGIGFQLRIV